jgi:predicted ribosomally synthesized peptide with SipW-like signal peptide
MNMKRKIRLSALIAVMVLMLALLIGGLYGYFDDTEESTGNTFTAGTLNLVVVTDGSATCNFTATPGGDGLNGFVVFENIAPGDYGYIEWTLTNEGNVDGVLTMTAAVGGHENLENEPELNNLAGIHNVGGDGDLDDAMTVELFLNGVSIYSGNLDGLEAFLSGPPAYDEDMVGDLGATSLVYTLEWEVDGPTVGNEIQSDDATLDMTFTLDQDLT